MAEREIKYVWKALQRGGQDRYGTAGGNGQVEEAYPYWANRGVQIHLSEGHVTDDVRAQKLP